MLPESFGLVAVTPSIYIESGANEATRIKLRESVEKAEGVIRTGFGGVASHAIVNACVTDECYEYFGGARGSLAKVYGKRILLSPRALNWHLIAHEWSHAEMSARLTFFAWRRMPQWFDEGLAVAVSEAPEHSEVHWQFLVTNNLPRPSREELQTLKSLKQWLDAIHKYEEDKNIERKAKGEQELRPVYSAAGHELRPWLAKNGSAGLLALIDRMNEGADFESAYQSADVAVMRDASQVLHSSP